MESGFNTIRSNLKNHSGDVELVAVKELYTVKVKLIDNCGNCASSTLTFSQLIKFISCT